MAFIHIFSYNSYVKRQFVTGMIVNMFGVPWHGWCQAGFSAHYTRNGTLLLGAPGTIGWRGMLTETQHFN